MALKIRAFLRQKQYPTHKVRFEFHYTGGSSPADFLLPEDLFDIAYENISQDCTLTDEKF
jgi:hypothetical protein